MLGAQKFGRRIRPEGAPLVLVDFADEGCSYYGHIVCETGRQGGKENRGTPTRHPHRRRVFVWVDTNPLSPFVYTTRTLSGAQSEHEF